MPNLFGMEPPIWEWENLPTWLNLEGQLTRASFKAVGDLGLLGMNVPNEWVEKQ